MDNKKLTILGDVLLKIKELMSQPKQAARSGIEQILVERMEQIYKHGYDLQRDMHINRSGDLVNAAVYTLSLNPGYYPSHWESWFSDKMQHKTCEERLVIAGALCAAAYDLSQAEKAKADSAGGEDSGGVVGEEVTLELEVDGEEVARLISYEVARKPGSRITLDGSEIQEYVDPIQDDLEEFGEIPLYIGDKRIGVIKPDPEYAGAAEKKVELFGMPLELDLESEEVNFMGIPGLSLEDIRVIRDFLRELYRHHLDVNPNCWMEADEVYQNLRSAIQAYTIQAYKNQ